MFAISVSETSGFGDIDGAMEGGHWDLKRTCYCARRLVASAHTLSRGERGEEVGVEGRCRG